MGLRPALCFVTVVSLLLLLPAPPVAALPQAPSQCSEVVFIGLRGSGEAADPAEYNMGEVALRTYEEFEPRARH